LLATFEPKWANNEIFVVGGSGLKRRFGATQFANMLH